MALYAYRCGQDGPVDVRRPIGTAPATVACPTCGDEAERIFTAPMLGFADRTRVAAIDRAEASRTEPTVVSTLPSRATRASRPAPLDPRTAGLPRP
jgi:putative FmdB family regulatory protein